MAYLLDTNIFIQAKNFHYGFDVCPAFWAWIDQAHSRGLVFSIKRVRDEILPREDDLAKWCKPRKSLFVESNDEKTYESLKLLSSWVMDKYQAAAQAKFLGGADFPLVGFAHAHSQVVS